MILTRRNRSESGIRLLRFASHLQANAPPPAQPRRDTPVKVRAENAGVFVHPTPDGVRATIAAGGKPVADRDGESDGESRGALLAAKRSLHHQQRVLANKVARAEERRRDVYSGSVYMFDFPPATRPLPTLPPVTFQKWLASRKLKWRLMRYDRRLLRAKQRKEQWELANKIAKNRERELSSTEACRNLSARELVQISERHRRDASCPQPPFRPDLPYGYPECLVSVSCFPCLLRIFSENVGRRAAELVEFDLDDKGGEIPGFAERMRQSPLPSYVIEYHSRNHDPPFAISWPAFNRAMLLRAEKRNGPSDERKRLTAARTFSSFEEAAVKEEVDSLTEESWRRKYSTASSAPLFASRFAEARPLFLEEDAARALRDEQSDAAIKAALCAVQVWGVRFPDMYYWEPSGRWLYNSYTDRWHASTGRFVVSCQRQRKAAFIDI